MPRPGSFGCSGSSRRRIVSCRARLLSPSVVYRTKSTASRGLRPHANARADPQEQGWDAADWDAGPDASSSQYPDISLLTAAERDDVMSLWPSSEQLRKLSSQGQVLLKLGVALVIFLLAARNTTLQIAAVTFPLYQDQLIAVYKNSKLRYSGKEFAGIWHATVLDLSMQQGFTEPTISGEVSVPTTTLRLVIGEAGIDGFSSELEVPWSPGCEQVQAGDAVEALVLSASQYFDDFQVVRDVYVPETGAWLCDYPFVKRDAYQRISADVYNSRSAPMR